MKYYHLFFLLLVTAAFGNAQDTVWTLQECIDRALKENISLQISALDVRASEIDQEQARQSRWPSLNASSNFGYNFGRTIDPTSNEFITTSLGFQSLSLNTGATLFNANRVNNSIRQARVDMDISRLNFEQSQRDIALRVANLYLNALLAKENLVIAISQWENAQNQAERSQKLVESGAQPRVTLLEFQAEAASREQAVIQSENDLRISILQLKQALNLPASEGFEITAPPSAIEIEEAGLETVDALYQRALNTLPSYAAAKQAIRSAQLQKKIANSAFYPSLTIGGNLNSNYSTEGRTLEGIETMTRPVPAMFNGESGTLLLMSQNPVFSEAGWLTQIENNLGYGAGLQLNIPIYNNYSAKANYQLAKISEIQAERQLALEEQNIRIDLEQTLADLNAARKSFEAAQRAFQAADLAYSNVQKQFDIGAISVYDLFESEQRRQTAQLQILVSKYNYIFAQKIVDFYAGQEIKL